MNETRHRMRWSILLPKDVPAARTARSALDEWLEGTDQRTADAARSIVTELVSNAVRFGRPPIKVTIERQPACLRIEVTDGGAGILAHSSSGEPGAWALQIIRSLAPRRGTLQGTGGVWCELPADRPDHSGHRP